MKNMKRIMCGILVAVLIFALVACGDKEEEGKSYVPDNSEAPVPEVTEVVYQNALMSNNLFDYKIQIGNDVYKLPSKLIAFLEDGWELPSYFDKTKNIDAEHYESAKLSKNGFEFDIEIVNMSGNQRNVMECAVGRMEFDFPADVKVFVAKDTLLTGIKSSDLIAKLGEPTTNELYDGLYREVMYETPETNSIYERYTFKFDPVTDMIQKLFVVNFIETNDDKSQSTEQGIEYLEKYVAPTVLGNDLKSFNVSIMDDLYTLPAPVSVFIKNGWEVTESKDVKAGTYAYEAITMKKDGVSFSFNAYNFAPNQVDAKNATIYGISQDTTETDLKVVLPGNISIGTSNATVESLLSGSKFTKNESTSSITYIDTTYDYMVSIHISKESNKVEGITLINKVWFYK